MQFVSVALVCFIAVQARFVSAHPAAGARAGEKSVAQLHEEFNKVGTQLQADFKKARAREDFKGDVHVQAVLNGVEDADKIITQLEKDLIDPKHPLSPSEAQRLANNLKALGKKISSEIKLLRPEQRQDQLIVNILQNFGKKGLLFLEIASKQESDVAKEFSGLRSSLTF